MDSDLLGPPTDPAMANLSNRLPFMELSQICSEYGYSYAIVWRPYRSSKQRCEVVKVDLESSWGDFATRSAPFEFKEGEGLPGRCFATRDVEHCQSLQGASDDARNEIAKELGVRGAFAIFRDGAVYEFGGTPPMEAKPDVLINSIGGSTGVASAAKAVQAVVRLGAMAKSSKKAAEAAKVDDAA